MYIGLPQVFLTKSVLKAREDYFWTVPPVLFIYGYQTKRTHKSEGHKAAQAMSPLDFHNALKYGSPSDFYVETLFTVIAIVGAMLVSQRT